MAANLNLFSRVEVDGEGNFHFVPGASQAGDSVTLRFDMDTLVIMHACPHPLNPASDWPAKPVSWQILEALPVAEDDVCMTSREENRRGFMNNYLYHLGPAGGAR